MNRNCHEGMQRGCQGQRRAVWLGRLAVNGLVEKACYRKWVTFYTSRPENQYERVKAELEACSPSFPESGRTPPLIVEGLQRCGKFCWVRATQFNSLIVSCYDGLIRFFLPFFFPLALLSQSRHITFLVGFRTMTITRCFFGSFPLAFIGSFLWSATYVYAFTNTPNLVQVMSSNNSTSYNFLQLLISSLSFLIIIYLRNPCLYLSLVNLCNHITSDCAHASKAQCEKIHITWGRSAATG